MSLEMEDSACAWLLHDQSKLAAADLEWCLLTKPTIMSPVRRGIHGNQESATHQYPFNIVGGSILHQSPRCGSTLLFKLSTRLVKFEELNPGRDPPVFSTQQRLMSSLPKEFVSIVLGLNPTLFFANYCQVPLEGLVFVGPNVDGGAPTCKELGGKRKETRTACIQLV